MHRYNNGEKDVFKIAEEHYILREQDINFLNTIKNN
jgi:hypothetical protein